MTIRAIFENGVFRPIEKVELPEGCEVELEFRQLRESSDTAGLRAVYTILSRRHSSGEHDIAERHNEHQP